MSDTQNSQNSIEKVLEELRQRRDEIELQIHMAKSETKEEWEVLEKKLSHIRAKAASLSYVAADTAENVGEALDLAVSELRAGYEQLKKLL